MQAQADERKRFVPSQYIDLKKLQTDSFIGRGPRKGTVSSVYTRLNKLEGMLSLVAAAAVAAGADVTHIIPPEDPTPATRKRTEKEPSKGPVPRHPEPIPSASAPFDHSNTSHSSSPESNLPSLDGHSSPDSNHDGEMDVDVDYTHAALGMIPSGEALYNQSFFDKLTSDSPGNWLHDPQLFLAPNSLRNDPEDSRNNGNGQQLIATENGSDLKRLLDAFSADSQGHMSIFGGLDVPGTSNVYGAPWSIDDLLNADMVNALSRYSEHMSALSPPPVSPPPILKAPPEVANIRTAFPTHILHPMLLLYFQNVAAWIPCIHAGTFLAQSPSYHVSNQFLLNTMFAITAPFYNATQQFPTEYSFEYFHSKASAMAMEVLDAPPSIESVWGLAHFALGFMVGTKTRAQSADHFLGAAIAMAKTLRLDVQPNSSSSQWLRFEERIRTHEVLWQLDRFFASLFRR
ncbi:hypothetical protein HDU93_009902 [Gonapodya sp. JEL0774]|nr:hypothetical protein HDU93_009902 [Gonapodya sp. JEL0774]